MFRDSTDLLLTPILLICLFLLVIIGDRFRRTPHRPNGNASSGPGKVCVALETLGEITGDEDDDDDEPRRARKIGGSGSTTTATGSGQETQKVATVPVAFLSTVGNASCGWKLKDFTCDDTSGWYVVAEHDQINNVSGPDATCLLQIQAWFHPPVSITATIAPENRLMSVRKHICSTAISSLLDDAKSADVILIVPASQPGQDDFKINLHRRVLAAKSGLFRELMRNHELADPSELDLESGSDIAKVLHDHPEVPPPTVGTIAPPQPRPKIQHSVARPHPSSMDPAHSKWRVTLYLTTPFMQSHILEVLSYVYSCCYSLPSTLSITFLISLLDLGHAMDVRGLTDVVKWYFATVMEHGLVNAGNVYPLFLCAKRHGLQKLSDKCARFMETKDRDGWEEEEIDSLVDVLKGGMKIDPTKNEGGQKIKIEEGDDDLEEFMGLSKSLKEKLAVE